MKIAFVISLAIILYTYLGYGIVLFILVRLKRLFFGKEKIEGFPETELPEVTFVVAAYNEEDWIDGKIKNCLDFDYPKDKIEFLFSSLS